MPFAVNKDSISASNLSARLSLEFAEATGRQHLLISGTGETSRQTGTEAGRDIIEVFTNECDVLRNDLLLSETNI